MYGNRSLSKEETWNEINLSNKIVLQLYSSV